MNHGDEAFLGFPSISFDFTSVALSFTLRVTNTLSNDLRVAIFINFAVNRSCVNSEQSCNCDISEAKWLSDEGYYISPESLGITKMVFLQQKDLLEDALGRITLGPLECVETSK